jgi:hypothetical protein
MRPVSHAVHLRLQSICPKSEGSRKDFATRGKIRRSLPVASPPNATPSDQHSCCGVPVELSQLTLIAFTAFSSLRIVSYVPQIAKVAADNNGASAIAYSTWSLWTLANIATALYAAVNLARQMSGSSAAPQPPQFSSGLIKPRPDACGWSASSGSSSLDPEQRSDHIHRVGACRRQSWSHRNSSQ